LKRIEGERRNSRLHHGMGRLASSSGVNWPNRRVANGSRRANTEKKKTSDAERRKRPGLVARAKLEASGLPVGREDGLTEEN